MGMHREKIVNILDISRLSHPVDVSPLTKRKPDKPDYVERFELFMNSW